MITSFRNAVRGLDLGSSKQKRTLSAPFLQEQIKSFLLFEHFFVAVGERGGKRVIQTQLFETELIPLQVVLDTFRDSFDELVFSSQIVVTDHHCRKNCSHFALKLVAFVCN